MSGDQRCEGVTPRQFSLEARNRHLVVPSIPSSIQITNVGADVTASLGWDIEMIELLLRLIDRLIDLKKYRNERLLRIFHEILEPTFNELLAVHSDYIAMFTDFAAMLPNENMPPEQRTAALAQAANFLRRKRIEFEPVRTKIESFVKEILGGRFGKQHEFLTPEADAFLRALVDYFPTGYLTTPSAESRATTLYGAIRAGSVDIERKDVAAPGSKILLSELVDATIHDSKESWKHASDTFAHLKLTIHTGI